MLLQKLFSFFHVQDVKPLGRWFNVGSNSKVIDILEFKEQSKKRRILYINYGIDPFQWNKKKQ